MAEQPEGALDPGSPGGMFPFGRRQDRAPVNGQKPHGYAEF